MADEAVTDTNLWRDARAIPDVMRDVAAGIPGLEAVVDAASPAGRIVVTGNGAAYYAAAMLSAAALVHPGPVEVVAVPAGLLATGHLRMGADDLLLVVSSSGELRDVIDVVGGPRAPARWALLTATADSTLGRQATARAVVPVRSQDAVTHTQAFVGNTVALLRLWQQLTGSGLGLELDRLADGCAAGLDDGPAWAAEIAAAAGDVSGGIAFGSGGAWPAALETALLLKEVAGLAVEGMETREGATTGMYALRRGHVAVAHPTVHDPWCAETEAVCAATGATVVRLPGGEHLPAIAAAVATFPAALALATTLGLRAGLDVDEPSWAAAYYATARTT